MLSTFGDAYGIAASGSNALPSKHTLRPTVTGASVLGIRYCDGLLLAADTVASYGSMLRYKDVCRIAKIGESTLIAANGEFSDFQYITESLQELCLKDWNAQDGTALQPHAYASYLSRVMYGRRSKLNPLMSPVVVAGHNNDGKPFLGYVDIFGTSFTENFIATGFGSYLATPILRTEARVDMTEDEARALLIKCLKILYLRHCQGYNKIRFAKATATGITIEEPIAIQGNWDIHDYSCATSATDLAGCSW